MSRQSVAKIAARILQKRSCLSPFLFDETGKMLEKRRQKILKIADFIFQYQMENIGGFEITDIVLVGSHATYMYHDHSDIDVNILVKNTENPVLTADEENLELFISLRTALPAHQKWTFLLDGKRIDFKIMSRNHPYFGIFSILNNCWKIKPRPDFNQKIKIDKLISGYYRRLSDIYTFMASLDFDKEKTNTLNYQKVQKFFADQVVDENIGHPFNYMVFKILEKRKQIRQLAFHIIDLNCRHYSFHSFLPPDPLLTESICNIILKPQPWLNPFIFDSDGNMHDNRRRKIIEICKFLFQQKLGMIPGLEISDIILCGSGASFYYRSKSDLDIKIIVKNVNCSYISLDKEEFSSFLALVSAKTKNNTYNFRVDGKFVDIKFYHRIPHNQNIFSLLYNRWIYFQRPDEERQFTEAELIRGEFDYIAQIYKFLQKLPRQNGRLTPKAINKIFHLFYQNDLLLDDTPEYKLIYHLLRAHGQLLYLSREINEAVNDSLSF